MSNTQVIVIGAGIAGLAASVALSEGGIDFLLLEGSNRIGGRINTIPFQIGAQWMHGTVNNPVYELAEPLGLIDDSEDNENLSSKIATQDGKILDDELCEKVIAEVRENIENFRKKELDDPNISVGELLDEAFEVLADKYSNKIDAGLLKGLFRAGFADERAEAACDDLHDQSAKGWNEFEDLEGNHFTKLKYGYGKVIEELNSKIPQESLKLNEIVERIDYRETDSIKITTYNSIEKKRKSYIASAVISTLPLGVLKRSHQEIFTPKLPSEKINAIQKLGFGVVDKLFVAFDRPFDDDFDSLRFIWRDDLDFDLKSRKKHNLKDVEFCKTIDSLFRLPIFDNVLIGFLIGQNAVAIENLDDDCLLDVIKELIEIFFPNLNMPKPIKVVRSRWASNSLSRGSYSYIKVGSSLDDMLKLAEPIDNRLFFAGEATTTQYSTVHGAYSTGVAAAERVIEQRLSS